MIKKKVDRRLFSSYVIMHFVEKKKDLCCCLHAFEMVWRHEENNVSRHLAGQQ